MSEDLLSATADTAGEQQLEATVERLANAAVSIASSLVAMTLMLREDRRREDRALRSMAQHLVDEAHRADAAASRADDLLRTPASDVRRVREFVDETDRDAARAWARLTLFSAAYPDLVIPLTPSWAQNGPSDGS